MANANAGAMTERVTSESMREATGRDWDGWFDVLDAAGAVDWEHKAIVAHLEDDHPETSSGWWRQSIAVGYEQARGKRVVGETAGAGFQVGVRRTLGAPAAEVWQLLTSRHELWLGEGADVEFTAGRSYTAPTGYDAATVSGEIRVVKPGDRLRLTWQPEDWDAPATLQLTLQATGPSKTAVTAHMEKLPDGDAREAVRAHWREILDRLSAITG